MFLKIQKVARAKVRPRLITTNLDLVNINIGRVDKYGRKTNDSHDRDNLQKFYRLEIEEGDKGGPSNAPDYARGEVLLESSDEDGEDEDEDSDFSEVVTLGDARPKAASMSQVDENADIDLDEDAFADLDAQAAAYTSRLPQDLDSDVHVERTRRIAVVNLDWDHIRAIHLYKIFSSLVSSTAPSTNILVPKVREQSTQKVSSTIARGMVLNVRVYPSDFGKERMAKEEKEGPPIDIFKKRPRPGDEVEINETNVYEFGGENDYDEDALRAYQLERLR